MFAPECAGIVVMAFGLVHPPPRKYSSKRVEMRLPLADRSSSRHWLPPMTHLEGEPVFPSAMAPLLFPAANHSVLEHFWGVGETRHHTQLEFPAFMGVPNLRRWGRTS